MAEEQIGDMAYGVTVRNLNGDAEGLRRLGQSLRQASVVGRVVLDLDAKSAIRLAGASDPDRERVVRVTLEDRHQGWSEQVMWWGCAVGVFGLGAEALADLVMGVVL